jgi:hypothetical protein
LGHEELHKIDVMVQSRRLPLLVVVLLLHNVVVPLTELQPVYDVLLVSGFCVC